MELISWQTMTTHKCEIKMKKTNTMQLKHSNIFHYHIGKVESVPCEMKSAQRVCYNDFID